MGAVLLHAVAIGAVTVVATPVLFPTARSMTSIAVLGALVLTTILVTAYGARAKARFAPGGKNQGNGCGDEGMSGITAVTLLVPRIPSSPLPFSWLLMGRLRDGRWRE